MSASTAPIAHATPPSSMRPVSTRTRLSTAGRTALPVAAASLVASWAFGGVVGLFASIAVAVLLVAFALARLHVRGVVVAPPLPGRAHVGDAFPVRLTVTNGGAWFTARHLQVGVGDGDAERLGGALAALGPGASEEVRVTHRLLRRGRHRTLRVTVATVFPLGLVERRLTFELPADLLGLPRLGSLNDLGALPRAARVDAPRSARLARGDEEFYGVKGWRHGMSPRRIHWRLSARRGRRVVREMRREEDPPVELTLIRDVATAMPFDAPRRRFERAVSVAATLAEHFLREGRSLRLTIAGGDEAGGEPSPVLRGRRGLVFVLTQLAEVELRLGEGDAPFLPELERAAARARTASRAAHVAVLVGDGATRRFDGLLAVDVEGAQAARLYLPGRGWGQWKLGASFTAPDRPIAGSPRAGRDPVQGGVW